MSKQQPDNDSDFATLFSGIKRLQNDRVNPYQQRPVKAKNTRTESSQENIDFTDIGHIRQENIQETHFNPGITRKLQRRIRQGITPFDDLLDLHGCTRKGAINELQRFFKQVRNRGGKSILIIHGKGNRSSHSAVLRPLVFHWLALQDQVLAWCPAQPKDGGSGASYIYLR